MPTEAAFQRQVLERIRHMFPGCIILKNDANYLQGIPDFVVFWGKHYAMLEFKARTYSEVQPNQLFYVNVFHEWAFGAFVWPETVEEVLHDLQLAFGTDG